MALPDLWKMQVTPPLDVDVFKLHLLQHKEQVNPWLLQKVYPYFKSVTFLADPTTTGIPEGETAREKQPSTQGVTKKLERITSRGQTITLLDTTTIKVGHPASVITPTNKRAKFTNDYTTSTENSSTPSFINTHSDENSKSATLWKTVCIILSVILGMSVLFSGCIVAYCKRRYSVLVNGQRARNRRVLEELELENL